MKNLISLVLVFASATIFSQATNFWQTTGGPPSGLAIPFIGVNTNQTIFAAAFNGSAAANGVYRSTNNGSAWTRVVNGLTNTSCFALKVHPASNALYVGTFGGGVFRSNDDGNNWAPINSDMNATDRNIYYIDMNASGHLFLLADSNIYRSVNNGINWSKINTGIPQAAVLNAFCLAVNASGHLFLGCLGNGGAYRSTNNGDNWSPINTGLTNLNVGFLSVKSNGNIFASTRGGGVFRSIDNGDNWVAVNTGLSNSTVYCFAINSVGDLFAGTAGGAFQSINNGANWAAISTGLTDVNVVSLALNVAGEIFAGTFSRGVFRSTQSTTAAIGDEKFSAAITLGQNFPNPFSTSTIIPVNGKGVCEVRDIFGRVVFEKNISAGEEKILFDGSQLPEGVYLYALRDGKNVATRTMTIVK